MTKWRFLEHPVSTNLINKDTWSSCILPISIFSWPIIMDRFDFKTFKSTKTMEDLKERYYDVVNELNAARGNNVEPLSYDVEHEKRRKEQLCKLWNRTKEQVQLFCVVLLYF
jgi:hypothetical protein